jgi:hypothetical protein
MGTGDGDDPRSPANRGWRRGWTPDPRQIGDGGGPGPAGWTPDPRQIGDGTAIPDPRQIGDGGGDGDRGFRALDRTCGTAVQRLRLRTERESTGRSYSAMAAANVTVQLASWPILEAIL